MVRVGSRSIAISQDSEDREEDSGGVHIDRKSKLLIEKEVKYCGGVRN